MSNCFYSGNPTTLESLLAEDPGLQAYYNALPPGVQQTLEAHRTVIQSPQALQCYAEKLLRGE